MLLEKVYDTRQFEGGILQDPFHTPETSSLEIFMTFHARGIR